MGIFALALMALQLVVLTALYVVGQRHVRGGGGPEARARTYPRVAMIVPLTGDAPGMREAMGSLFDQDYPDYVVYCVTESADDPAVALVAELAAGRSHIRQLVAGQATTCGQKNHSILAGIRAADTAEIYAFCDSSHVADRSFLTNLVSPIARGDAVLASGFHRIVPLDFRTATLGMLATCLALHLMQSIRAITQPWGGAMAISRQAFERYDLQALWSRNIVDDFSMGPHLHRWKLIAWPVASACLRTPLADVTLTRWDTWLTRQLLYLKFCLPSTWLVSIAAVAILSVPPAISPVLLAGWLVGLVPAGLALGTGLYLGLFLGLGLVYRTFSPRPVPLLFWWRGYYATFLMLGWCFGRTFTTNTMSWRGIDYKVGWGGVVKAVIRHR